MSSFALTIGLNSMEAEMGKIKEWIMDMEEDAIDMDLETWCAKHGESVVEVYHEARRKYADLVEDKDD